MKMVNDPSMNYYEVEKAFIQWEDSVKMHGKSSLLYRFFHKQEMEEQKEVNEEAQEQFHHWAYEMRDKIDGQGNRLSQDQLWQQYDSYKKQAGANLLPLSQGGWIDRGPYRIDSAYGNVMGKGRAFNIAIHPADSNIIYVGAYGLWKSTDEGLTWTQLFDSIAALGVNYLTIDPNNGDIVYAMVSNKLYKTSDGAATWTVLSPGISSANNVKLIIDPANSQVLYLMNYPDGIKKSTDGGSSWTTINTQNIRDLEMKPGSSNTFYAIAYPKTVMISTDGAASFDTLCTVPFLYNFRGIAVTAADSNYIYAFSGYNGSGQAAVSVNGGLTFTLLPVTTNTYCLYNIDRFEVSQADKNFLVYADVRISRSLDGGATWSYIGPNFYSPANASAYVHVDHRNVMFYANSIWSCNDGGVSKTADRGLTWSNRTGGMGVANFYSIACSETDSSIFSGGTIDDAHLRHRSSGWENIFSGDGFDAAIKPTDPMTIYGKNQYSFARSFDCGQTLSASPFQGLTESTYSFSSDFPIQFNRQNPNSMYLMINNVWKSIDNGNTVVKISNFTSNTGGKFLHVSHVDSNIIFTAFYRTINNGTTWTLNSKIIIAVDPDEPNKVWGKNSFSNTPGLFFSTDTGNTWMPLAIQDIGALDQNLKMRPANNTDNGIYLVNGKNIYYLDDRLSNWQPFNNGLPYINISDMFILEAFGKIRISTNGRGIWESSLFDNNQPPAADFIANKYSVCTGDTIQFYDNSLNNGPGYNPVYQWSFPGASPAFSNAANPRVAYTSPGVYTVTLSITNSNGTDAVTKTSVITSGPPPTASTPLFEGFEGASFPPAGWNVNNYTPAPVWSKSLVYQNTYGGYQNSATSAAFNSNINSLPRKDWFTSPLVDLSALPYPMLTFDHCYPYEYITPDTLRIFYTTDCGSTKNYLYAKGGLSLKTDSITPSSGFVPDSSSWATDTVSLWQISNLTDVQFGFEASSYGRCIIFLDNINIVTGPFTVGVEETAAAGLSIIPNPASEQVLISFGTLLSNGQLRVMNIAGQEMINKKISGNELNLDVSAFPKGIYIIEVMSNGTITQKKLVKY
jgi:PKD repeat protein/photosystem II stability/assembly factor-like uncharacterized protein